MNVDFLCFMFVKMLVGRRLFEGFCVEVVTLLGFGCKREEGFITHWREF